MHKSKHGCSGRRLAHRGENVHCPWPGGDGRADRGHFLKRSETGARNLEKSQVTNKKTTGEKYLHIHRKGLLTCFLLIARNGVKHRP